MHVERTPCHWWGNMSMDLDDLVAPDGIIPSLRAKTKKHALQELADRAARMTGLDAREIFEALVQRERLGSTGLGRGIAIPHVKFRSLKSIRCLFARLAEPIDFDSHDGEPVDLVFVLLGPEHASGDHLRALARISRLMRDPVTLDGLRAAKGEPGLRELLFAPAASHAA